MQGKRKVKETWVIDLGLSVVFYDGDECLGGGIIVEGNSDN